MRILSRPEQLPSALAASLRPEELAYLQELEQGMGLPFGVTPFYASLVGSDRADPLRRQCIPDPREKIRRPWELSDPLGSERYSPFPRLVHQYHDRVLLLANGTCAGYCRHCFRRDWTAGAQGFIGPVELTPIQEYLRRHDEVEEVLVSGGDPLVAGTAPLDWLFTELRKASPGLFIRLASRVPVTWPDRIDEDLINLLKKHRPLRVIIHINHPRELAEPVVRGLERLVAKGVPVHSQTVLLKGINDDGETLKILFRGLLSGGVTPYYLFQGDLAPGTSHFRCNLERAIDLYEELSGRLSSLAVPTLAVDLPGGGGKIRLRRESIQGTVQDKEGFTYYLLSDGRGKLWKYPVETD
ncbi:MAG: KamA family radical SAM protein [Treponemataceae bacterium]|nr:KamA family radical SAM protein [Treponemataceae bacterium]